MVEEVDVNVKPSKNYPLSGAIFLMILHLVFVAFIFAWSCEKCVFTPAGGNFIFYSLEVPGVMLTKALGLAENLDVAIPYVVTFFTNTIFYSLVGFGLGTALHELGWMDEVENLPLTEDEVIARQEENR